VGDHLKSPGKARLLFATIAAGGGHVASARAMAQAVERLFPDRFEIRISDFMREVGEESFDRRHKAMWRWALRYPQAARFGQRVIDALPRPSMRVQRRLLRSFARKAATSLARDPVDLVVSNHGLVTTGLALAQRHQGLDLPALTFATEPHAISAYWADPWADLILVPTEEARRSLLRMGVPACRLEVVGYPVQQAFLEAWDQADARRQLGLEDRFTCLVSLGGEGVSARPAALVEALRAEPAAPQVVVICGRNAALRDELRALRLPGLRVEGYVEGMAAYLAACDVVIGKAGPASVYEALAVGRPVLVTGYAGLNERGVVRFLEQRSLGRLVPDAADLRREVRRLQSDPEALRDVRARCLGLGLREQTDALARRVVGFLDAHRREAA
jgi:UDP-N-acetylglucosamine:LPS N-acetylglucosamine transferase